MKDRFIREPWLQRVSWWVGLEQRKMGYDHSQFPEPYLVATSGSTALAPQASPAGPSLSWCKLVSPCPCSLHHRPSHPRAPWRGLGVTASKLEPSPKLKQAQAYHVRISNSFYSLFAFWYEKTIVSTVKCTSEICMYGPPIIHQDFQFDSVWLIVDYKHLKIFQLRNQCFQN